MVRKLILLLALAALGPGLSGCYVYGPPRYGYYGHERDHDRRGWEHRDWEHRDWDRRHWREHRDRRW